VIVTLSRQLGSEGDAIAGRVAAELGLALVDRAVVHQAALAAGIPEEMLQRLAYEGQRTMAAEILENLRAPRPSASSATSSPLLGVFAPAVPLSAGSLEDAAQSVHTLIRDISGRGNVLVLGQGGQSLMRGREDAFHVLVVAPPQVRVTRVMARDGISLAAARRQVRASDDARGGYLLRYHNVRWLDSLQYHLVINTGQTPVDVAVKLIVTGAQALGVQA
jgi:cytidylate kinase